MPLRDKAFPHLHWTSARLADGSKKFYYYAWKGGPRIKAEYGTQEFARDYSLAHNQLAFAPTGKLIEKGVREYLSSPEYVSLSPETKKRYRPVLDDIRTEFGELPCRQTEDIRFRQEIKKWRDQKAGTPRSANIRVAVLSTFLSWLVDNGDVKINIARGIKPIKVDSDFSDVIWFDDELEKVLGELGEPARSITCLAALTGLRQKDLLNLKWEDYDGMTLTLRTSKRRIKVIVPLVPKAKALLIKNESDWIFPSRRGTPYTGDGFRTIFMRARDRIGIKKRFHDLKGTAVTKFCIAGLDDREIAGIVGWSEKQVAHIRKLYASKEAIAKGIVARLEASVSK